MLSNELAAFSTNYGVSQTARPSVSAGGILFLNVILSPVPKPYLSLSRFSINISRNNDQFSLQTPKANFSISLGFLPLIRTVSVLLTSDSLDFRLRIYILNTASLFYVCMFFVDCTPIIQRGWKCLRLFLQLRRGDNCASSHLPELLATKHF